jgi:YidC/Oxa1 family membrane protein insertase
MSLKMQELAPELRKLKEKYPDDMQARHAAMMKLYRAHGVRPLGSCWILLLQMPVFMGLYYCLQESVHFRLSSFLWVDNLAAPDMMIKWGESIPMLSRPEDYGGLLYLGPYFNLLPILAVACMVLQQKMFMPPPADDQQAMQQKMMKWMMILFGIFFYRVAAGLCLYFITSTLWGFMERKLLPKKQPGTSPTGGPSPAAPEPAPAAPTLPEPPRVAENRAKRRQERKRRQQDRSQFSTAPSAPAPAAPSTFAEAPTEENGDGDGWWARFRRRIGNWWKDVLRKASKK